MKKLVKKTAENANTFWEKQRFELSNTNLNAAISALELIGKHSSVQAFSQKVEVNHTNHLEQILNERCKAVEDAAAKRKLELVD